ncbi:MAG: hypothetical protein ACM359_13070 [Bacillota bacterium]
MINNPSAPPSEDESLLCPFCGYDLRATQSDRCSECGHPIDRASLQISSIPWAHRHELGRFRAYLQTLWQFTLNSPSLAYEASKPQDPHAARTFRYLTATLVAAVFLAPFILVLIGEGLSFLAIQPQAFFMPGRSYARWLQDILVPWSAGATLPITLPIALILFAIYLTGIQRFLFRPCDASPARQERLRTLALYTTAPLAFLVPAALCAASARVIFKLAEFPFASIAGLLLLAILFLVIALIGSTVRTAQWAARVRHAGIEHIAFALLKLLVLWSLGSLLLLGLFPWSLGFFWIVLDSFR